MSFSTDGVKLNISKMMQNALWRFAVRMSEGVLSVLFVISLAGPMVFPQDANAVTGVSKYLSYQGRLTDTSGNPLGGAGATYYFCFSVYNASTGGTKLWPSGTPTATSTMVTNGVFNVDVGSSGADVLDTYDFAANDAQYLNIEASATSGTCGGAPFESLAPRQRLAAVAYARVAADVYGTALRTSSTRVQAGAGTGQVTPIWTRFDNQNTAGVVVGDACPSGSVMGDMWYNSSGTRALMCGVGSTIKGLDNATDILGIKESGAATTINAGSIVLSNAGGISISQSTATLATNQTNQTIGTFGFSNLNAGGISTMGNTLGTSGVGTGTIFFAGGNNITLSQATGAGARTITIIGPAGGAGLAGIGAGTQTATSGTIVFQNGNNVTFGLNGQTLTASAPAGGGGGGGFALQDFANISWRGFISNVTNMTAVSQRPIFTPFVLPGSLTWNWGNIEVSRATSGSNLFTAQMGIYSFVNATQLSLMGSLQNTYSNTATASISGIRRMQFTGMGVGATALTPGHYVMGMNFSAAATASMNYSLRGAQTIGPPVGNFGPGANANTTATSQLSSVPMAMFLGRYTATTAALPNSVAFSQVQQHTSMAPVYFYLRST